MRAKPEPVNFGNLKTSELARAFGVSRSTPFQWHRRGCPQNSDGTWSLPEVIAWHMSCERDRANRADPDDNLDRWRGARADLAEIELRQKRGGLVDMELVLRTWQKHVTDARTILQTVPSSIGLLISDDDLRAFPVPEAERIVHDGLMALAEGGNLKPSQNQGGNGAAESET